MTSTTGTASTTGRFIHDTNTGEIIGLATEAQTTASDQAGPEGLILIDSDGDVIQPGTWAAQQPGTRNAYVAA